MKVVTFVVSRKIQWQNFSAIVPSLIKKNCLIYFVSLDAYDGPFEKPNHINDSIHFQHVVLKRPETNRIINYIFNRRFLVRFLQIFCMNKSWNKWLQENHPNLVIFGIDHSIVNSYMVHLCNKKHVKSAVLQDAYIPSAFWRKNSWKSVLDFIRYTFDIYLPYAPHPFKSGALSIGVIGDERKHFMQKILPRKINVVTVGSPRLDCISQKRGESIQVRNVRNENTIKIVFIHTNTPINTEIEDQQQQTLLWVCDTLREISISTASNILLQVVMHSGVYNIEKYREYEKDYRDIVKLYSSNAFAQLIVNSDSCLTYSSTGIIDCFYVGCRVGIVTSPEIKNFLPRAVLDFGIEHINSKNELITLIFKANSADVQHHISKKVANFAPGWDSIEKTSQWIMSLLNT